MRDVSELDYVERDGLLVADLRVPGCQARVIKYDAGAAIPLHRHSGRSVKVVLRGAIVFATAQGDLLEAAAGDIYPCTGIPYRGEVVRDSYLLAIDEIGSERILVDAASPGPHAADRPVDIAGELLTPPRALRRRDGRLS